MNTPFPYHKVVASRLGGITNGMVVSWPKRISARGVRPQFTHLVDVMPTVLELAGIAPPASLDGVPQQPFDGVSFAYSLADAKVPEKPRTQYFEIFGNAALYQDGWLIASPVQPLGRPGAAPAVAEKWELYDLRNDSSQTVNLADRYPDKLRAMRAAFEAEARRNNVLPVSSDSVRYLLPGNRPEVGTAAGRYTFYPSDLRYPRGAFPSIHNRSWSIEAELEVPPGGGEGVLVTQGGRFSGWGLVLLGGVPSFLYRTSDTAGSLTRLTASKPLPPGSHRIEVSFKIDGPGLGKGGALAMKIDSRTVATGRLEATAPIRFSEEDASVGRDTGTTLVEDYRIPFRATGLRSLTIVLGD
jgi:arylsulfatase